MELTDYNIEFLRKKYQGKKVGFTCSCFDILHCGHCIMLEDAKNQCDILIIGLQTDPTIDRVDKNKPIQEYEERLIMAKSIKYIDEIITYSTEKDLYNLLLMLKPDVRIIGTDWKDKKYTGHDLPIEMHWHVREHDWSTSKLRKRIYNSEKEKELNENVMNENNSDHIQDDIKMLWGC